MSKLKAVWYNDDYVNVFEGLKVSQSFAEFAKSAFNEKIDRIFAKKIKDATVKPTKVLLVDLEGQQGYMTRHQYDKWLNGGYNLRIIKEIET